MNKTIFTILLLISFGMLFSSCSVNEPPLTEVEASPETIDQSNSPEEIAILANRNRRCLILRTCSTFDKIIYVNDTAMGSNDGSSWTNAYNYLQDAISAWEDLGSPSDVPIWVAAGVYYPDDGMGQVNDDPDSTFDMKSDLAIYGGFADDGKARLLTDADPDTYLTILSGDLDGNDTTTNNIVTKAITDGVDSFLNPTGSNANHVATASGIDNSTLDGLVITAGLAGAHDYAGGMLIEYAEIDLKNLWFSGNASEYESAAIDMYDSIVSFDNVNFSGNTSHGDGGAVYVNESNLMINNSDFTDNTAGEDGGALHMIDDSEVEINNSSFSDNTANDDAGAIEVILTSSIYTDTSLTINNTVFSNNRSEDEGGAIRIVGVNKITIINSSFIGNSTLGDDEADAGAIMVDESSLAIINSIFSNNYSNDDGGVLYITDDSNVDIINSSFSNNSADDYAGAIRVGSSAILNMINSIVWGNSAATGEAQQISHNNSTENTLNISYSIVEGGEAGILDRDSDASTGVNYDSSNLDSDPLFTDADNDDLTLTGKSPAIDSGDSDAISETTDLAGNDRFADNRSVVDTGNNTTQDSVVDRGAYEHPDTCHRLNRRCRWVKSRF